MLFVADKKHLSQFRTQWPVMKCLVAVASAQCSQPVNEVCYEVCLARRAESRVDGCECHYNLGEQLAVK